MATETTTPGIVWVLWNGTAGGTESVTVEIVARMRRLGRNARILILCDPEPICDRIDSLEIPWDALGLRNSRGAFFSGRQLASYLERQNAHAVILPTVDAMGSVIRRGGFRGTVIAIDHGSIANLDDLGPLRRSARLLSRQVGVRGLSVQVCVSDFVQREVSRYPHAESVRLVYNGVDTGRFQPAAVDHSHRETECLRIACACRLVRGKGLPDLLEAVDRLSARNVAVELKIAGTGPLAEWVAREGARRAGIVRPMGHVDDMPAFWRSGDVCVSASHELTETFGMVAVEAMSCGLPVVATRNGGLPEVVADGITGLLVEPGDVSGLTEALARYAGDSGLRHAHGRAGRDRAVGSFDLDRCAREYLELCEGESV